MGRTKAPSTGLLIAYGQSGDDTISNETGRPSILYGDAGNDTPLIGHSNSAALGGSGNDHLIAGNNDSLLIGGTGADLLEGGNGIDILVAGYTSYDAKLPANPAALMAILAGSLRLTALNTSDDTDVDDLRGGNGKDTFALNFSSGVAIDKWDRTKADVVIKI